MGKLYDFVRNSKYKDDLQVISEIKNGKKELGLGYYVSLIDNFCERGKMPEDFDARIFNWLDNGCPKDINWEIRKSLFNIEDYKQHYDNYSNLISMARILKNR